MISVDLWEKWKKKKQNRTANGWIREQHILTAHKNNNNHNSHAWNIEYYSVMALALAGLERNIQLIVKYFLFSLGVDSNGTSTNAGAAAAATTTTTTDQIWKVEFMWMSLNKKVEKMAKWEVDGEQ